jgi:Na+/proline symporter
LLVDAINDVVQGSILVIGLLVLMNAAVADVGGWTAAMSAVTAPNVIRFGSEHSVPLMETLEAWSIPVLGSLVAAELVSRLIAARSEKVARRSAVGAGVLYIVVGLIPVFLAIIAAQHVGQLSDPEQLLPSLAERLLPTGAYMIFAAGLISAILSTVDSTLLVAAGLFSHNVLVPLMHVQKDAAQVRMARLSVMFFGVVCYFLALSADGVFELVEQASAFGSSGVLVSVVFGLFTTFGGWKAASVSLVAGVASYLVGTYAGLPYPYLGSVATALGSYVLVALLERRAALTIAGTNV